MDEEIKRFYETQRLAPSVMARMVAQTSTRRLLPWKAWAWGSALLLGAGGLGWWMSQPPEEYLGADQAAPALSWLEGQPAYP